MQLRKWNKTFEAVIASAAKQSIAAAEGKYGLLHRFAPRNDDTMN
jgi:hypothetical protein